jgi:hypothetical protein
MNQNPLINLLTLSIKLVQTKNNLLIVKEIVLLEAKLKR